MDLRFVKKYCNKDGYILYYVDFNTMNKVYIGFSYKIKSSWSNTGFYY